MLESEERKAIVGNLMAILPTLHSIRSDSARSCVHFFFLLPYTRTRHWGCTCFARRYLSKLQRLKTSRSLGPPATFRSPSLWQALAGPNRRTTPNHRQKNYTDDYPANKIGNAILVCHLITQSSLKSWKSPFWLPSSSQYRIKVARRTLRVIFIHFLS